ncbi:hypothetical protein HQ544_00555 [Candidatus Falkowbacteria bacterium]|nr:hypothetical protein [Candidatus Falkowbacteria bacterium]
MVIKTDWFYNFLGPLPFAEKYLNTEGGSVLAYKAIGLIAVFVGFLMIFNLFEIFLKWVLPNSFFGG